MIEIVWHFIRGILNRSPSDTCWRCGAPAGDHVRLGSVRQCPRFLRPYIQIRGASSLLSAAFGPQA